jgi:hypothetical protein
MMRLADSDAGSMGAAGLKSMSYIAHIARNKCPKRQGTVQALATYGASGCDRRHDGYHQRKKLSVKDQAFMSVAARGQCEQNRFRLRHMSVSFWLLVISLQPV